MLLICLAIILQICNFIWNGATFINEKAKCKCYLFSSAVTLLIKSNISSCTDLILELMVSVSQPLQLHFTIFQLVHYLLTLLASKLIMLLKQSTQMSSVIAARYHLFLIVRPITHSGVALQSGIDLRMIYLPKQ